MSNKIENLVICGAVRTPFSFGNSLKELKVQDLLEHVLKALPERYELDPKAVSGVVIGEVQQDTKAPNLARIASLRAGYPETSSGYTIQNNCNSGFVGLTTAIGQILMGEGDLYISGGAESMSNFGYRLHEKEFKYGSLDEVKAALKEDGAAFMETYDVVDCLPEGLTDSENNMLMIEVAEIMANKYGVSREEQDEYVLRNLQRAVDAIEGGKLEKYIAPIGKLEKDAYPLNRKRMLKRPESFSKAACIFNGDFPGMSIPELKEKHAKHLERLGVTDLNPTVTMYTSCIPGDGAGACILTTEDRAKDLGLKPLLRVINWAAAGVDPVIMGIGPMESTHKAFEHPKTERAKGLTMEQIDVLEVHEAFAAQVMSVFKESERKYNRKWDMDKVNPYGGSIAFTHPLGATNARLITNILSRFDEVPEAKYALATGCAGGGQGTTVIFERYS